MKNFAFPQIFKPILEGDNNLSMLLRWNQTLKQMRTQYDAIDKLKKRNMMNCKNQLSIGFQWSKNNNQQTSLMYQDVENKSLQGEDKTKKQRSNIRVRIQTQVTDSKQQDKQKRSNVRIRTQNRRFRTEQNANKTVQKSMKKVQKESRTLEQTKNKTKLHKTTKTKSPTHPKPDTKMAHKPPPPPLPTQNKQDQQQQIQTFKSHKDSIITLRNSRKNVEQKQRSKKYVEEQSNQQNCMIESKLMSKSQRQRDRERRRYGIDNKKEIDVDVQVTADMLRVIQNNSVVIGGGGDTREWHGKCLETNDLLQFPESDDKVAEKNGNTRRKLRSRRIMTTKAIESEKQMKQISLFKKTYTIWDIQSSSELLSFRDEKQVSIGKQNKTEKETELQKKNEGQEKKVKKKVRFGRTSIEQNSENCPKTAGTINSHKNMRKVGIPKRSKQNQSIQQIGEVVEQKPRKNPQTFRAKVKKAPKFVHTQRNNVYNQLNYFRLRMNATSKQNKILQTNFVIPQPIIVTVENIKHQIEYQRIQRTKQRNMMIDFGVRLTRDCKLKQIGVQATTVGQGLA